MAHVAEEVADEVELLRAIFSDGMLVEEVGGAADLTLTVQQTIAPVVDTGSCGHHDETHCDGSAAVAGREPARIAAIGSRLEEVSPCESLAWNLAPNFRPFLSTSSPWLDAKL